MHLNKNLNEEEMIQAIGNNAVREAQKRSLENGVPNVYSKNGILYYQLPRWNHHHGRPFFKRDIKTKT